MVLPRTEMRDILYASWRVPSELLQPYLYRGLELDLWDRSPMVSIVCLTMRAGPMVFPEVNVRFYVRRRGERGVVFIKEIISSRTLCAGARLLFHEPFERHPLRLNQRCSGESRTFRFHAGRGGALANVTMEVAPAGGPPVPGSQEEFLMLVCRSFHPPDDAIQSISVIHPPWQLMPILSSDINVDWGRLVGEKWRALDGQPPDHLMAATGSEFGVEVERR